MSSVDTQEVGVVDHVVVGILDKQASGVDAGILDTLHRG